MVCAGCAEHLVSCTQVGRHDPTMCGIGPVLVKKYSYTGRIALDLFEHRPSKSPILVVIVHYLSASLNQVYNIYKTLLLKVKLRR